MEGFARIAFGVEVGEQTGDGVGNFFGGATIAYGTRDGSDLTDTAADAEVVGVDHLAIGFDFLALDADVGNPVLPAGVGAAGNVETKLLRIIGETIFELLGEPAGKGFGFGEGEFAEFRASASDGATGEGGSFYGKTGGGELVDDGGNVGFGDIDEQKILHWGVTHVAIAVTLGEIGGKGKLRRSDAAADDRGADGIVAGLFLRNHADVVAMNVRGRSDWFSGIEWKVEAGLQGGQERVGGPVVLEEEIFHARFFARVAKNFGIAEEGGNGADHGNNLVPLDEGVERNGEMRLRGEAAGYTEGKTGFEISGEWRSAIAKASADSDERDVVDFGVGAPVGAGGDGNFEFAGEIVEVGIAAKLFVEGGD